MVVAVVTEWLYRSCSCGRLVVVWVMMKLLPLQHSSPRFRSQRDYLRHSQEPERTFIQHERVMDLHPLE